MLLQLPRPYGDCPRDPHREERDQEACEAEKVMMDVMCGTGYQSDAMRVLRSDFYTPTVIEADEKEQ